MSTADRPKAYSYVRFSSPEQAKGNSLDRQTKQAREYAEKNRLDLADTTYRDLGVSAFQGQNANKGALWLFRRAVEDGEIPAGSYLLIENFDRLSRMEPWDALPIFQDIINNGITIVTLQDRQEWSRDSIRENPYRLFAAISIMIRANEESATKSRRVRAANDHKRLLAASELKPFTSRRPGWLSWNSTTKQFLAIPDRAKVVQEIFTLADQGRNYHTIAQMLNERGEPTWGRSEYWRGSYVRKVLSTSAVIGTFTPNVSTKAPSGRTLRQPQQPIENYFPAVVDRDLFERVTARLKATAARGRNASTAPRSIFAGLMKCGHCGATVTRMTKGEHIYLVCTKATVKAGCRYQTVRYPEVEARFCDVVEWLVDNAPRGQDTSEIEERIAKMQATADHFAGMTLTYAEILAEERSEGARKALRQAETKATEAEEQLRVLRAERDRKAAKAVNRKLEAVRVALTRRPLDVAEANRVLREAVRKIVMKTEDGVLWLFWHHSDAPSPVHFTSRHKRWTEGAAVLEAPESSGEA